jgi:hypothetical protein
MDSKRRALLCCLTLLLSAGALPAQEPAEPCLPQYAAAALVADLMDIGMTTSELRLLNGNEEPKLRRHLEFRLAMAAAEARHVIGLKPAVTALHLPSLVSGLDRAVQYVAAHPLEPKHLEEMHENDLKLPGMVGYNVSIPAENLEYVRAWVKKQPWASPQPGAASPH